MLEVLDELQKIDAEVFVEEKFSHLVSDFTNGHVKGTFSQSKGLDSTFDMFVSFGGDGTMLRAVTYIKDYGIPIVGVNTGRLGFLSTFKKESVRKLVTEFVAGTIPLRSVLWLRWNSIRIWMSSMVSTLP